MSRPIVFFDWDGTLADSMPLCIRGIQLALQRIGHPPLPEALISSCNGPPYEDSVRILGLEEGIGPEFLRLRRAAELEMVPTVQRLYPGIKEMLARVGRVADLAIISNGLPEYLALSLPVTGLEGVFAHVQARVVGQRKVETLGTMLSALHPCYAIMVGDRSVDIAAGRENHLPTVGVSYGYGEHQDWLEADRQADSPAQVADVLLEMLAQEGRTA